MTKRIRSKEEAIEFLNTTDIKTTFCGHMGWLHEDVSPYSNSIDLVSTTEAELIEYANKQKKKMFKWLFDYCKSIGAFDGLSQDLPGNGNRQASLGEWENPQHQFKPRENGN